MKRLILTISSVITRSCIPRLLVPLSVSVVLLASPLLLSAAIRNVTCSGDITSALSTAIGASATGDIVNITAGSCSMSSRITINDKNITIRGAGKGVTNIDAPGGFATINVSGSNNPMWRITGMSLSGTTNTVVIQVWGTQSPTFRGAFRIDHISMSYPNGGQDGMIQFWGPIYGLIDHADFTQSYEAVILTNLEVDTESCSYNVGGTCTLNTLQGAAGAALPFQPGSGKNLYIEDSTFTGTSSNGVAAIDTAYGGGRIVFRHNTLNNAILYAHWTAGGSVNSLWWEIYNNKFIWNLPLDIYPMRMQGGGTGLIHDNTFTGYANNYILLGDGRLTDQGQSGPPTNYCNGSQPIDGNAGDASAPGWPCLAQTGRDAGKSIAQILAGDKPGSFPMYIWHNGPQDKCSNPSAGGPACANTFGVGTYSPSAANYIKSTPHVTSGFGNGDVDYKISASQPTGAGTHTLTYTPFTYPYPLTANGMPDPNGTRTPLQVVTNTLPNAIRLRYYSQTLQASGGSGSYLWSVSSGTLPPGLRLDAATGVIRGRARLKGTWSFTLTVQDAQNAAATSSQAFTMSSRLHF